MGKTNEALLKALPPQEHTYYKTHISIEAGYKWGEGMDPYELACFYHEMKTLFTQAGWSVKEPKYSSGCPELYKGGNKLYCHPMELSGPLEQDLLPEVEQILSASETCQLRSSKTYEQIYDMSEEQYTSALDTVRDEIEKDLLYAFKTNSRSTYHIGRYNNVEEVADLYRVPTLERYIGICSDDPHMKYVEGVFHNLVDKCYILCADDPNKGKLYRTATGPERLEFARKQAASLENKVQAAQTRAKEQAEKAPAHQNDITADKEPEKE